MNPDELRQLSQSDLEKLAGEIRQKIISTCFKNGGHMGASLGTVELTLALHSVFHSPEEPLIWDVGHQAYAHKLICGRWDEFHTLRQFRGISGFLQRTESPHDILGAGHSSTALSTALAYAWKKGLNFTPNTGSDSDQNPWTVAIIGDGGLTAGLSFEALNQIRTLTLGPLLVVLNDNQMSISENVGAVSTLVSRNHAAEFFQIFGLEYWGPVDGHHLSSLIEIFKKMRNSPKNKPILLHVLTQKGRGYEPAEARPASFHGIGPIPTKATPSSKKKSYSEIFGQTLCELAKTDQRVVGITAAMREGTGLDEFARSYPSRFFDVGIAEAHAVTFAAGLGLQGLKPVVAIYSTFLQRSLDSIIHDVALQNSSVIFAIDRAGLVGADGPTHHGVFDLAYLGMIPNLQIKAPCCYKDLRMLLQSAVHSKGPIAIRYPRGSSVETMDAELVDETRVHQSVDSPQVIVVGLGDSIHRLLSAVHEVDPHRQWITAISTVSVKPIPQSLVNLLDKNPTVPLVTLEDGVIHGGFGQALVQQAQRKSQTLILGYSDHFVTHGSVGELYEEEEVSHKALVHQLRKFVLIKFALGKFNTE